MNIADGTVTLVRYEYEIQRDTGGFDDTRSAGTDLSFRTFQAGGVEYTYRVRAVSDANTDAEGEWATIVNGVVLPVTPDPPAAVENLTIETTYNDSGVITAVTLFWTAPDNATRYSVARSTDGGVFLTNQLNTGTFGTAMRTVGGDAGARRQFFHIGPGRGRSLHRPGRGRPGL